MKTITKPMVKQLFPKRPEWSHKGDFGKLLVVGGSLRYSGSPAFVALAAIRTGTDLTVVAAPRRAADIIARFQPDLITEPLSGEYLRPADLKHIISLADWADAVVIGGGLDRKPQTYNTIRNILRKTKKPCVIDAEAIRAVSGHRNLLKRNFVITPHENEFYTLTGKKPSGQLRERTALVQSSIRETGCSILLKGHVDIISDGKQVALNRTGNPYMTKGGTGDTLAGICGALLAIGVKPFDAACAAAWINGSAGDLALRSIGGGFFVSEMLDFIPRVIR